MFVRFTNFCGIYCLGGKIRYWLFCILILLQWNCLPLHHLIYCSVKTSLLTQCLLTWADSLTTVKMYRHICSVYSLGWGCLWHGMRTFNHSGAPPIVFYCLLLSSHLSIQLLIYVYRAGGSAISSGLCILFAKTFHLWWHFLSKCHGSGKDPNATQP